MRPLSLTACLFAAASLAPVFAARAANKTLELGGARLFVSPLPDSVSASTITLWLYWFNDSDRTIKENFAFKIEATWHAKGHDLPCVLRLATSELARNIPPEAFYKVAYTVEVPAGVSGEGWIEIPTANPIHVNVDRRLAAAPPGPAARSAAALGALHSTTPAQQTFGDFLGRRITPYEPIFFMLGSNPAAEFQFSLKVQLFTFATKPGKWLDELFFGYTQTSYWDLLTSDPYFYDTSYKPSFFLYHKDVALPASWKNVGKLQVQAGYEHESNGRGGINERSLNTLYFQPTFSLGAQAPFRVTLQPRVWYYLSVGANNLDLAKYRGYGDLKAMVDWHKLQLAAAFGVGSDWEHTGTRADFRYDLTGWHIQSAFQIEAYSGYGQTLLQYDRVSHGLRAGFSLWYPTFKTDP